MEIEKKAKQLAGALSIVWQSLATISKCLLLSRKAFPKARQPRAKPLVVMGNGPSLTDTMTSNSSGLRGVDFMAVNFAPNSQLFFDVKPRMLVLADPHFFHGMEKDSNVARLWRRIGMTDWPLTLYVPARERETAKKLAESSGTEGSRLEIKTMNLTPAEGFRALKSWLYDRGLAMPRPRNVLIPTLMSALREGYRDIRLIGADHSWSRTLWVDDMNRVVSVQPHFYPDDEKERSRVALEYQGYHIHDIYTSLSIAFRSYFDIADYGRSLGAEILNCTPGSFIDAFPRGTLNKPPRHNVSSNE